jgi:hypothetical protein
VGAPGPRRRRPAARPLAAGPVPERRDLPGPGGPPARVFHARVGVDRPGRAAAPASCGLHAIAPHAYERVS